MKISKKQLKEIILEEIGRVLNEESPFSERDIDRVGILLSGFIKLNRTGIPRGKEEERRKNQLLMKSYFEKYLTKLPDKLEWAMDNLYGDEVSVPSPENAEEWKKIGEFLTLFFKQGMGGPDPEENKRLIKAYFEEYSEPGSVPENFQQELDKYKSFTGAGQAGVRRLSKL